MASLKEGGWKSKARSFSSERASIPYCLWVRLLSVFSQQWPDLKLREGFLEPGLSFLECPANGLCFATLRPTCECDLQHLHQQFWLRH